MTLLLTTENLGYVSSMDLQAGTFLV